MPAICKFTVALTAEARHKMADYSTQVRQLAAHGSSNIEALNIEIKDEIVVDPSRAGNAILRVELSITNRLKNAPKVAWADFTQKERIFIREHAARLKIKRLPDQSVMHSKLYGLRHKQDMINFLQRAPGGVCCFELFDEYPDAHQDVLDLLESKKVVSYGTDIWDGETTFLQHL